MACGTTNSTILTFHSAFLTHYFSSLYQIAPHWSLQPSHYFKLFVLSCLIHTFSLLASHFWLFAVHYLFFTVLTSPFSLHCSLLINYWFFIPHFSLLTASHCTDEEWHLVHPELCSTRPTGSVAATSIYMATPECGRRALDYLRSIGASVIASAPTPTV